MSELKEMKDVQLSVRALAAMMKISLDELADRAGIDRSRMKQISAGNVRMYAYELRSLSSVTGIPATNIDVGLIL
jgi:transcriptional regulator with XRE-family HTH domain